jgi:hypothetical protein
MSSLQTTSKFLRFVAILQVLTALIVFLPENLLATFQAAIGLGQLPHLPLFLYVLRGAAYCQGAIGVLLWIIAGDVVRYRALVLATGVIYLAAAPAFCLIHAEAGTPMWWAILDSASCFAVGAVVLLGAQNSGIASSIDSQSAA